MDETTTIEREPASEIKAGTAEVEFREPGDVQALEHYQEIRDLNLRLLAARRGHLEAKDEASSLKKDYDRLVDELAELIARGPDSQRRLSFDQVDGITVDPKPDEPDDAWLDVPLVDALALSTSQFSKLADAGAKTIGQLEDLRAGEGIASIKGFGQKAVDKIEDQIVDWLTENRDKFGEPVDDAQDAQDDNNLEGMFAEDDLPEDEHAGDVAQTGPVGDLVDNI